MKTFLVLAIALLSSVTYAQSLRSECENAYYATDYVKLHQYTVTVTWAQISDNAHKRLEYILFDKFKVLDVKELTEKSIYKIKENSNIDPVKYEKLIEELIGIPARVTCTLNI